MNLAQLFQSQNFALLMQALDQAGALTAGRTVPARLLSLEPDGTATAAIGDTKIALVLAGPEAKQAALQPGATLMLKLEAPEKPGGDLRATLVDIRPPAAGAAPAQAADPAAGVADRTARTGTVQPAPGQPSPSQASAGATPPGQAPSNRPAMALSTSPAGTAPSVATPPAEPTKSASAARQPVASAAAQGASAATPSPSRAPGQPPAEAAAAPSPRLLAGPLLGAALQRQDSLAPLFANLRGLAEGSLTLTMPRPVLAAAERVLAHALPAEGPAPSGPALQAALRRSGLFSEAAAGRPAGPAGPAGDLKVALQSLRATLEPLVSAFSPRVPAGAPAPAHAATASAESAAPPPPPRRDGPLAPQPMAERTIPPGESPLTIAATLLGQTDAALDRITLSQFASLPLDGQRPETGQASQQRWLAEIPLAFQTGTAILPLQIEREPPRRGVAEVTAPVWRVRFALDVEPMGPLQGVVTLQGRSVGVTLWAEREDTCAMLRGAAPGLEAALLHADFGAGSVDVHTGRPQTARPLAGQFLDRLS